MIHEQNKKQDEILQAFQEAKERKEEQLTLLEGFQNPDEAKEKEEKQEIQSENIKEEVVYPEESTQEEEFFIGADGMRYTKEEWESPVTRNGPTRKEIEGWKEKHGPIYIAPFDDEVFVFRTLLRPEYREIIRDTTLTALDREELFTEKCVLYPYDFSLEKIKKSKAGIASILSEMIMEKSGFVAQSAPIKL